MVELLDACPTAIIEDQTIEFPAVTLDSDAALTIDSFSDSVD